MKKLKVLLIAVLCVVLTAFAGCSTMQTDLRISFDNSTRALQERNQDEFLKCFSKEATSQTQAAIFYQTMILTYDFMHTQMPEYNAENYKDALVFMEFKVEEDSKTSDYAKVNMKGLYLPMPKDIDISEMTSTDEDAEGNEGKSLEDSLADIVAEFVKEDGEWKIKSIIYTPKLPT